MSPPEPPDAPGERRYETIAISLVLLLAGALLALRAVPGSSLTALDDPLLDRAMAHGASAPVDTSAVTVVLIDDASLAELQERWPIRRRTWADFLSVLHTYDPSVVALDAWFEVAEPSVEVELALDVADRLRLTGIGDEPMGALVVRELEATAEALDGDLQLSRALTRGPTLLGFACVEAGEASVPPSPLAVSARPRLVCPGMSGNQASLALAATGQAALDTLHDRDGMVRRYPFVTGVREVAYPSLALDAVRLGRPDAWPLALARVLTRDGAAPYLRVIDPSRIETVRFSDVLMTGPDDPMLRSRFQGRIVFVGVSAQGTKDAVFNALGEALPGVYLHANGAIDLLADRHVWTDGAPGQLGGLLGALVLLVLGVFGTRARSVPGVLGAGVGASAAWGGAGLLAFSGGWMLPIVPVWLGAGGWTLTRLGFAWVRVDRARKSAQAARESLLVTLQERNAELKESLETLRRTRSAKERMESELRIGRDIQLAMVPDAPPALPRGAVALRAVLEPAREVGGDFYDYLVLDDDKLCVVVGDVSGKGVPAALFMAVTKTLIASAARTNASPGAILTHANEDLARNNESCMFVTLFVAILDLKDGALAYANAGHNPPYLRRADGSWERLDARHGPVVGAVEDLAYGEDTVRLAPEDLLLLYTDGITEAMDPTSALYGEHRMLATLEGDPAAGVAALVDRLLGDLATFQDTADQADDITVLALQLSALAAPDQPAI